MIRNEVAPVYLRPYPELHELHDMQRGHVQPDLTFEYRLSVALDFVKLDTIRFAPIRQQM